MTRKFEALTGVVPDLKRPQDNNFIGFGGTAELRVNLAQVATYRGITATGADNKQRQTTFVRMANGSDHALLIQVDHFDRLMGIGVNKLEKV